MAIIHPYSDSNKYGSGGIWAPTAANFPSCKHFWSCPQTDIGTNKLTDLFGNVSLVKSSGTIAAPPTTVDGFSVYPNQNPTAGATVSGTLYTPTTDTNSIIIFAVGQNTAGTFGGNFVLGDQTNGNAASLATAGTASLTDGTNNVACTAFASNTQSVIYGRALVVHTWNDATATASHGIQSFEANVTTLNTALARLTSVATASAFSPTHFTTWGSSNGWGCGGGATAISNLYGAAMFSFTAARPPAEILNAVTWMTYQWSKGNKWIYPGWKGIS